MIERGDFESGGCLGWETNGANVEADRIARGGRSSCRVCDSGQGSVWGIFQNVRTAPAGTYVAQAFVRTSGTAGPSAVDLGVVALDGNGQQIGPPKENGVTIAPNDDWRGVTNALAVQDGQGAAVSIMAASTPGGCFLVDDVTLLQQ